MSTAAPQKISNNYFDGLPVTGPHKAIFFIIMMAYFCEQMDNWNFGFIAPAVNPWKRSPDISGIASQSA